MKGELVEKVLKTNVSALVELNMVKNLAVSAIAGALGGLNAYASNIVSAVFIATRQDPAQNIKKRAWLTIFSFECLYGYTGYLAVYFLVVYGILQLQGKKEEDDEMSSGYRFEAGTLMGVFVSQNMMGIIYYSHFSW